MARYVRTLIRHVHIKMSTSRNTRRKGHRIRLGEIGYHCIDTTGTND